MGSDESGWSTAERILCVRLDALGDLIMTGPAIRAVKNGVSTPHVTLLTSSQGAVAAPLLPGIDEVIVYDSPWMKSSPRRATSDADLVVIDTLKESRFDAAIIFTAFSQNPLPAALLCYLGDIPLRIAHCRENPYQLLTTWVRETEPEHGIRHEVVRQLDLVRRAGFDTSDTRLSLLVPDDAREQVQALVEELGLTARRWVVVHPGASAPSRRYPPESFSRVIRVLADRGLSVVVTGSMDEHVLAESVIHGSGVAAFNLAGRLNLWELVALYEIAPIVLSNNTGPAHIAAAVGAPIVDLYALTNPQHTPWSDRARTLSFDVPCRNCFKSVCPMGTNACLAGIEPELVAKTVVDLLSECSESGITEQKHREEYVHTRYQCGVS